MKFRVLIEPDEDGVKIHELELDKAGNIEKAPQGYRTFFLTEERALLGTR